MTKLAQIQEAILQLAPNEQQELRNWLLLEDESPAILAAIDEAESSLAEEGGVPLEDVRRNLRQWITK